jgi:hypothetical protein
MPTINKKQLTLFVLAFFALVAIGFDAYLIATRHSTESLRNNMSIPEYAKVMEDRCKEAPYRPTCYEQQVPTLVTEMPVERIFDVIRQIRQDDPEYLYCHVLAHKLGEYEVSLDPSKWLDVIAKGPTDGLCSNGFAHGAIVTRFHDEELTPEEFQFALKDLDKACEERPGWTPTDLTKAICYHGIGHVLIHMTEAKVAESLAACEQVALKSDGRDYRQLCTEGVYMQLFQPLEPEDFALIDKLPFKPTHDTLQKFCSDNSSTTDQYGACWREGWPFVGDDLYTSDGLQKYCGAITDKKNQDLCYVSAFTINGRHYLEYPDKMAKTCNAMPAQYQGMCFSRGANAFPEEDPNLVSRGVDFCGMAEADAAKDECYRFLANVASFNFHPGSQPFETLCSSLPETYQAACRGGR